MSDEKKEKRKNLIGRIPLKIKLYIVLAIVVIVGGFALKQNMPYIVGEIKEAIWGTEEIVSETTITQLLGISELSTCSYDYSAVVSVYKDEEARKEDKVYDYAWYNI